MDEISKYTHELRAPINTLMVILSLMEQDINNKEKIKKYISECKMLSNHILMLVQEILDFDKLNRNDLTINESSFNMYLQLNNLMPIFHEYIVYMKKQFKYSFSNLKHYKLIGDKTRFIQIIANLLSNAEKYSRENDIITFEVIKDELINDHTTEITFLISDTGIGMDEEFLKNEYFSAYKQVNDDNSKIGHGLGGYIIAKLIKMLNGKLQINSKLNEGTSILLTIPFKLNDKEKTDSISSKKILFVDDDKFLTELLSGFFAIESLEYDFVSSAKDAELLLTNKKYDVVFTDIELPDKKGYELLKNFKSNEKWVAMSANQLDYIKYGFDDFMLKPFIVSEVLEKIN